MKSIRDGAAYRAGKALRERVPRSAHGEWTPAPSRPDPVATLRASDEGRLASLLPIRYERMASSPLAFLRGAAAIMADDLARSAITGIPTQIGGDAHLMNFGAFATPERRYIFDVNDFDETIVGPWEFDLKRLCASVAVAGGDLALSRGAVREAVLACARSYREHMAEYAELRVLDMWYARIDESELEVVLDASNVRKPPSDIAAVRAVPDVHRDRDGAVRGFVERPPLLFRPPNVDEFQALVASIMHAYRHSLAPERRSLFDRFRLVDAIYKVVGVGSVGTRCSVVLFVAGDDDTLLLQIKEARRSVHEPALGHCGFADQGERVVAGQRAMQSASDLFLGWARGADGRTYYLRQLRDLKTQANVAGMSAGELERYAVLCAHALARAHAKAGGCAAYIAGYLGRSDVFDEAMVAFARAYAACNARDYAELLRAAGDGRVALVSHL